MRKTTFILLIAFLTISCVNEKEKLNNRTIIQPERTIITGKIDKNLENSNFEVASLFFDDAILNERFRFSEEIDSSGFFKFVFYTHYSQNVLLQVKTHFGVFINPGDSLHITLTPVKDYVEQYKFCTYSGDAVLENEILKKEILTSGFDFNKYIKNNKKLSPSEFKQYLIDKKANNNKFLDGLFNEYDSIPTGIYNYLKYGVLSSYISHISDYPHHHSSMNKSKIELLDLGKDYYDVFDNYTLNINQFSGADSDLKFFVKHKLKTSSLKVIQQEVKGKFLQDILICRFVANEMRKRGYKEYEKYENVLAKNIESDTLFSAITNYYIGIKKSIENTANNDNLNIDKSKYESVDKLLEQIKEKHKGKVVYIDCWATWCAPCRKEMSISKVFHSKFDSKKVSFAYLCLDSGKKQWKNVIATDKIQGDHYFLDNNQSQIIREKYKIEGIPFYIIIDQNGNIRYKGNEFRPSNKITETEINKLL